METTQSPALLLLNLPPSALAGIDLLSFTTTPRFRGVKHIPRGWHFAFVGASTAFSERHGLWFNIDKPKSQYVLVSNWDAGTETLRRSADGMEILRWRANLGSVWKEGLTPYRQSSAGDDDAETMEMSGDWPILTSSINEAVLDRILGAEDRHHVSSASSSKRDLEDIPGLKAEDLNLAEEEELHFLPIDLKQTWREGATGRERTDAAQDRSWALENIIEKYCAEKNALDVIGEMQFCFIMVLTINNFSCLEQWKRLLTMLFTCKKAVAARPDFFVSVIAVVRLQLQHCKDAEGGLIDLADDSGSLLKALLVRFRKGVESLSGLGIQDVVDELDDLEEYLRKEHGWQWGGSFAKTGVLELEDGEQVAMDTTAFDEDDETGEFAPQVVDLTPEQAKMLNLPSDTAPGSNQNLQLMQVVRGASESEESDDDDGAHASDESEAGDLEDMDARY